MSPRQCRCVTQQVAGSRFDGLVTLYPLFRLLTAFGMCQPSPERQQHAVIRAIRDIIWRAVPSVSGIGRRNYAVLAVPGSKPHFPRTAAYAPDGLTETLLLQRYGERSNDLASFVALACVTLFPLCFSPAVCLLKHCKRPLKPA